MSNLDDLLKRKAELLAEEADARLDLQDAKDHLAAVSAKVKGRYDSPEYQDAKIELKNVGLDLADICSELGRLNKEIQPLLDRTKQSFEFKFVEVAKEVLTTDQFASINREARSRIPKGDAA